MSHLSDFDELRLAIWDRNLKRTVDDAIASYRAGAHCPAVVAAWTTIVYDYVYKLRHLDERGDANASKRLRKFDSALEASRHGNRAQMVAFEHSVIASLRDDFQLVDEHEALELERLREDRHRCAHPSFDGDGAPLAVTADLARNHVSNMLRLCACRPPSYGARSLEEVIATIEGTAFPMDIGKAAEALRLGPLGRPRPALLRAVVVVLLKRLLREADDNVMPQLAIGISAVARLFPAEWVDLAPSELERVYRSRTDEALRLAKVAGWAEGLWDVAREPIRHTVEQALQGCEDFTTLLAASSIPELRPHCAKAIAGLQPQKVPHAQSMPRLGSEQLDVLVDAFCHSTSFVMGNAILDAGLHQNAGRISAEHVERIAAAVRENPNVQGNFRLPAFVRQVVANAPQTAEALNRWNDELVDEVASGLEDQHPNQYRLHEAISRVISAGCDVMRRVTFDPATKLASVEEVLPF